VEYHVRWEKRVPRRACLCKPCPAGRPSRTRASRSDACVCCGATVRLPGACGPDAGGPRRSGVRPSNSCACGSRASWLSCDDLADKYASLNSSTGTPKYSNDPHEYIRSRQHHPAIPEVRPPSRPRVLVGRSAEKCCKTASRIARARDTHLRCGVRIGPLSAPGPPHSVGFFAFIHRLWITLWITMLITCKDRFYVRGL